ncbi:hypothetical protein [Streptomyces sp. NPDC086023]|uniref:hypothetical protein n=1 Tax=Streptomyces sp. NPDC086023 TaxID=3365746 RepID=UPI0037D87447
MRTGRMVAVGGARVAAAVMVLGAVAGPARAVPVAAAPAEADVAYHGQVSLAAGLLGISLLPENHGPAALVNATVRLRLSVPLADAQQLAAGCARAGERVLVCETGALPVSGKGRRIEVALVLKERPAEAVVRIDTWWNGGAVDSDLKNNEHAVLALDTGDSYVF